MVNVKALSGYLMALGFAGLLLSFGLWSSGKPTAPTEYERQRFGRDLFGSIAISSRDNQIAEYNKCFTQGSTMLVTCPLGGSLHILTWASGAMLLFGGLLRASVKSPA